MARRQMKRARDSSWIVAEENFIADTQQYISMLLLDKNVSRAELARLLGVSVPRISNMMKPGANLTLRTIADVFSALGEECEISSPRLAQLKSPISSRSVSMSALELEQREDKITFGYFQGGREVVQQVCETLRKWKDSGPHNDNAKLLEVA
jgi:transcriptional regulator with XRE-family HTH domain